MVCIKHSKMNRTIKYILYLLSIYGTLRITSCDKTNCIFHTMILTSILLFIDLQI